MTVPTNTKVRTGYKGISPDNDPRVLFREGETFTKSNGTIMARLYERLMKRSRRRQADGLASLYDQGYRRGVYAAYNALRNELK